MIPNLCNLRLFLFIALFSLSGCQIDQSMSILKEKLFSDTDEQEKEDKKISKSLEFEKKEFKKSPKNKVSEQNDEKIKKDQLAVKLKNDKPKKDSTLQQKESKDADVLPLKEMGQTKKTDRKIISFFTKFFEDENLEDSRDKKLPNESTIQNIEKKVNKNSFRTEDDALAQFNKDDSEYTSSSEVAESAPFSSERNRKDFNDLEYPSKKIKDEIVKDSKAIEEVNDKKKKTSGDAFLNL